MADVTARNDFHVGDCYNQDEKQVVTGKAVLLVESETSNVKRQTREHDV